MSILRPIQKSIKIWITIVKFYNQIKKWTYFCTKNIIFSFFPVAKQQVVEYTQKSQIKHENRHIQLVREYGFHPRTKATVEDGDVLPKKFEPFPEDMYGKPLEEIDSFIYEEVS